MSLSDSVILELCKAVFTAVFVAGGAALIVWRYQARREDERLSSERRLNEDAQARDVARADRDRDDAARLQLAREKRSTKAALASKASDIGGSFYFLTQRRQRQRDDPDVWGPPDDEEFDDAYVAWATRAEAFEQELGVWYGWDGHVAREWHQVRDLLTVRYFSLRDKATPGLRAGNARQGDRVHSGLSADELLDQTLVVRTFRAAMPELLQRMLGDDITV